MLTHLIFRQIGPQTRMVSVDVTADSDIDVEIFTFNGKDCPKLDIDDLFWIGMHDGNRNGEHKWATGKFPLPQPLQWYRDRPARTGKLRELIFLHRMNDSHPIIPTISTSQENVSIWVLRESGRVETAEQHRCGRGGSMQSARGQKRWWRVQLKSLKRPPAG